MTRTGRVIPRRVIDAHSACLAAAWIGLWLLWPNPDRVRSLRAWGPETRVSYVQMEPGESTLYLDPTVFGRHSAVGFPSMSPNEATSSPEGTGVVTMMAPRYLEVGSNGVEEGNAGQDRFVSCRAAETGGVDRFTWEPPRAFDTPIMDRRAFVIEPSPALLARSFQAPDLQAAGPSWGAGSWQVEVYVEFAADGTVESVFLESGCHEAKVNQGVVRAMYRARIDKPGTPVAGRVTIGCSSE
jgi:hypothetical protein